MYTSKYMLLLLASAFLILFNSCDDDVVIPNEEELITTLIMTFSPDGGGSDVEFRFTDLDGDGGDPPVINNGILDTNTTYNVALRLLNESENPAEEVTDEIEEEDEEHQFFFETGGGLGLKIVYSDQDSNGDPIGLASAITTVGAEAGTLKVTLRHEPDKAAPGVSDGDITNAGGETDIEVTFNVTVQE